MIDPSPEGAVSRFAGACLSVLLAVVALWAAVQIVQAIWVWLAVAALVTLVAAMAIRLLWSRRSPW
jgi:fatty acid desaturase